MDCEFRMGKEGQILSTCHRQHVLINIYSWGKTNHIDFNIYNASLLKHFVENFYEVNVNISECLHPYSVNLCTVPVHKFTEQGCKHHGIGM